MPSCRAASHGFTEAELAEAKSNILNAYQQRVRQQDSRKSETIASALASSADEDKVFSDPTTDLKLAIAALDSIDLKEVHDAFTQFWDAPGFDLILTTKQAPQTADKDLAALFQESHSTPVEPPAAREVQAFGYTNFGKPGTVASRKEIKISRSPSSSFPTRFGST